MTDAKWVLCPICQGKTRVKIRKETELKYFPLYCPKCKQETIINVECQQITVVKDIAAS